MADQFAAGGYHDYRAELYSNVATGGRGVSGFARSPHDSTGRTGARPAPHVEVVTVYLCMPNHPTLFTGDVAVDDRGQVSFVNEFNFAGVKRFYAVKNHRQGFVRAWHAHRHEAKYMLAVAGSALVGAVAVDDWDRPSRDLEVHRFVLSAAKPRVLYIPAGYANGFMSLSADAHLIFFSTSTLAESQADDTRYDARYWDIWTVEER